MGWMITISMLMLTLVAEDGLRYGVLCCGHVDHGAGVHGRHSLVATVRCLGSGLDDPPGLQTVGERGWHSP